VRFGSGDENPDGTGNTMVNSMITIIGLGDHDRQEWPITIASVL
jgi:hypothetical protein